MELLEISERDRCLKVRNKALSTDDLGREVLVGLDRQQSEWLLASLAQSREAISDADRRRYLNLYTLHEIARLAAMEDARMQRI